jgi:hypothetical protein
MQLQVTDAHCPRCHKPITVATIERDPTRNDIAHHTYECADCGPVMMRAVSLLVVKPPLGKAA